MASANWFREHGSDASIGKIDRFSQRPQLLKREAERDWNASGKIASPLISPICWVRCAFLTVVSFNHRVIQDGAEAPYGWATQHDPILIFIDHSKCSKCILCTST